MNSQDWSLLCSCVSELFRDHRFTFTSTRGWFDRLQHFEKGDIKEAIEQLAQTQDKTPSLSDLAGRTIMVRAARERQVESERYSDVQPRWHELVPEAFDPTDDNFFIRRLHRVLSGTAGPLQEELRAAGLSFDGPRSPVVARTPTPGEREWPELIERLRRLQGRP